MQAVRYLRELAGKLRRVPPRSRRAYARKVCFPQITLDDLPTPAGEWNAGNNALQSKNNVHFIVGLVSLLGTLAFGFATEMFKDAYIMPEEPAEIECYCEAGKCTNKFVSK